MTLLYLLLAVFFASGAAKLLPLTAGVIRTN